MWHFLRDPGADGVGVAITSAAVNLSDSQPAERREAAYATIAAGLGVPVAIVAQVHGSDVVRVRRPEGDAVLIDLTDHPADALVTSDEGVALAVRVADCVPILFADPVAGVVGAAHAGREGLLRGGIGQTVAALRELGARQLTAWVGPRICEGCYEVPPDMAADAAARLGVPAPTTRWGTTGIDLGAAARAQLADAGVAVEDLGGCTFEDPGLHSHRRDGAAAGRQVGVVWIAARRGGATGAAR